jgi:hypothetical protein
MDAEAAGSVAPSESHNSSGQQQEESLQQGGSVNWGQATAQSPVSRVGGFESSLMLLGIGTCRRQAGRLPCLPLTRNMFNARPAEGAQEPDQPSTPRTQRWLRRGHIGGAVGAVGRR